MDCDIITDAKSGPASVPIYRYPSHKIFNIHCIVLNVFRTCYMNKWFCKFWIYISKYILSASWYSVNILRCDFTSHRAPCERALWRDLTPAPARCSLYEERIGKIKLWGKSSQKTFLWQLWLWHNKDFLSKNPGFLTYNASLWRTKWRKLIILSE